MNVLDLFSGIGGFSLGLERAGMRTVAFCEIDPEIIGRAIMSATLSSHHGATP
jgi:site-specific DNA-cytosine methylase